MVDKLINVIKTFLGLAIFYQKICRKMTFDFEGP